MSCKLGREGLRDDPALWPRAGGATWAAKPEAFSSEVDSGSREENA
jgi:hypothetical protein